MSDNSDGKWKHREEQPRLRRLEAAILKDRITQVRLRFADLGIPLEVKQ